MTCSAAPRCRIDGVAVNKGELPTFHDLTDDMHDQVETNGHLRRKWCSETSLESHAYIDTRPSRCRHGVRPMKKRYGVCSSPICNKWGEAPATFD